MTYSLGVDLGTKFIAAAIARPTGVEMFTLGERDVVTPAVVHIGDDGTVITGEAADRRAVRHPDTVGRDIKCRLGEPEPIMLGDAPYPATTLLGAQLRDVVRRVAETEGGLPERIVLTLPASWERSRRELFEQVASIAGLDTPQLVTEPEAAVRHAMAGRPRNGQIVAVYDLGGGSFDATVLRTHADGLEILGTPERIDGLGGAAFDEAVLAYVDDAAGGALTDPDPGDAQTAVALARLRQDCVLAKEALSLDHETVIPVFLPGRHLVVRLTRAAFEEMVHAAVETTIGALSRTVRSAGLTPSDLGSVLLVGGSSRIPLIAEMVSREFGCPTVADARPEYAVALGAATMAAASVPALSGPRAGYEAAPVGAPERPAIGANAGGSGARPAAPNGSSGVGSPDLPAERPRRRFVPSLPTAPTASLSSGSPRFRSLRWGSLRSGSLRSGSLRLGIGHLPLAAAVAVALLVLTLVYTLAPGVAGPPAAPDRGQPPTAAAPAIAPPAPAAPAPVPPSVSAAQPTVAGTFRVGAGPRAGAVTPDGGFAYIASTGTKSISVVDLATNAVVADIPIEAGPPVSVALSPDGSRAYVGVYDRATGTGNAVVVLDTQARTVSATIPVDKNPYSITVRPDGRQLYVPSHDANLVAVIDTATNAVVNRIAVKPNPHSVAFSVDGGRAYVANHASSLVTVLDTANGAILAEIPVGPSPHSVAMSPDGARLYVANFDADSVTVVDPAANTVTGTIPVQREPQSVEFAPDGRHAYVVNGSDSVSVIDTATGRVTATLGVGRAPTEVFLAPDGRHAYVTNLRSDDVTVLNTSA